MHNPGQFLYGECKSLIYKDLLQIAYLVGNLRWRHAEVVPPTRHLSLRTLDKLVHNSEKILYGWHKSLISKKIQQIAQLKGSDTLIGPPWRNPTTGGHEDRIRYPRRTSRKNRPMATTNRIGCSVSQFFGSRLFTAGKLSLHSLDKAVHNLQQHLYGASKSLILKDK